MLKSLMGLSWLKWVAGAIGALLALVAAVVFGRPRRRKDVEEDLANKLRDELARRAEEKRDEEMRDPDVAGRTRTELDRARARRRAGEGS